MAARSPRRSFAHPFVVTVAGSAALAACFVESAPARQPQGTAPQAEGSPAAAPPPSATTTTPPTVIANPPRPGQGPAPTPTTTVVANPPRPGQGPAPTPAPTPPTVIANPPPPQVAKMDRRWTVTRSHGACLAYSNDACPQVPAGQPIPPCNPPAPTKVACPELLLADGSLQVVQYAGRDTCTVDAPSTPSTCPPKTMCNPPPPRKVACPP